jgi:hypothetical protein
MEKVYNEISRCAGAQFDEELAEVFVKMLRKNNTKSLGDDTDSDGEFIDNLDLIKDDKTTVPLGVDHDEKNIAIVKSEVSKEKE